MRFTDVMDETYHAMSANKVRSSLTVLGIVIGISSVIAMISVGQGAQNSIQASIQSIGANLVLVTPGAQRGPGFTISTGRGTAQSLTRGDADAVASEVNSVEAVAPELTGRYQISAKGTNTNTSVIGTTGSYPTVRNVEVDEGSFISDQNDRSLAKVAVLGPTARDDLFGEGADALGDVVRIKGVQFKVIGITKSKGGSGFNNPDDAIYVPLTSAQRYLAGSSYLSTISVEAVDAAAMTQMQQDITTLLLNRHHISDPTAADFSTINEADIIATASSITGTLTILLAAIAGISLVVGGIGIMNMMLTTVTERTREIGLRKAIGATRHDITVQFLAEAVALTGVGGVIGILLGWALARAVKALGLVQTSVSISSVILAFGVAAGIGILFGYYPARRAAQLNPIEALRYE